MPADLKAESFLMSARLPDSGSVNVSRWNAARQESSKTDGWYDAENETFGREHKEEAFS